MDSSETTVKKKEKSHRHQSSCLRCSFALLLYLLVFLSISFLLGFVVVFVGNSSISNPILVSSQCKIVSSSVDLRSSKVCELGLLNYKAKHVFYPFEGKKFRCRHDYYWASVFEVEYKYHSGETQLALAEAPNEALPVDCRPNFGVAWLTKDKFKVNETYDCWYTFGFSKVNIYHNSYFNCQAKDPSTIEMLRRFFILSPRILESWFARNGRAWFKKWEAIAGVITGFLTSLISITLIRVLQQLKSSLPPICGVRMLSSLKRACLFVAYFSLVGWLVIQYGKKLGLPEIFRVH
ncbi:uncharacterized protein LOC130766039 [Actinidia eriantha]|uniref:uncharacterized protein LOC130766039 n=1 Tax=Actinidia eriantha TaxID=165200 RepID=UPI0025877872|nr:uncharacterized protein LOC130766039 [Actinidia eriantha]